MDSNADGKFDADDKLLGQLTEVHDGYHTADNLLAGGYFVREQKAPEGYKLDENAYYFAITEDGQVAVIENGEAGRGFTNEAQRGNLKIIKDSSDGRKDGFSDRNTIVYGHNMRDGSMLATLNYYTDQSWFEKNPRMYLDTPHGGYGVEIFSAFPANPSESGTDASPWRIDFKDDGAFSTWIAKMAKRSVIKTGVEVTGSDKVLTLSTCNADGSARFIVMGKLIQK